MKIIGVISDTHKLLRPQACEFLRGSDLIIHGGDIGCADVITGLEAIAPVQAIRGNIDKGSWAEQYPVTDSVEIEGKRIYILHNRNDLDFDPAAAGFDIVISGHSHKPKLEKVDEVLYLNPGSAGPRRFSLPIALAKLIINGLVVAAEIHEIPA